MARAALAKMREEQSGAPSESPAAARATPARAAAPVPPSGERAAPPVPPTPPTRGVAPPATPSRPAAATPEPPAAESPGAPSPSETVAAGVEAAASEPAGSAPAPPAEQPAAPAPVEPAAPAAAAASGASLPPRAELESAFTDAVLPQLKGVAKAIFTAGQFVGVTDTAAVFALENAPTRDRAEKSRPDVEAALAAHFGGPVPLLLIDKADSAKYGGAAPPSSNGSSSGPGTVRRSGSSDTTADAAATDESDVEDPMTIDVSQLENADVAETGLDRLTRAFPGATLIEIDEENR